MNKTIVAVTSRAGVVQKYTLNTKKLTTAEEATYKEPETEANKVTKKYSFPQLYYHMDSADLEQSTVLNQTFSSTSM